MKKHLKMSLRMVLGLCCNNHSWSKDLDFKKESFITLPLWVKIFDIPTIYWTREGISVIASKLGNPLFSNEITSSASYLDFVRIYVDMKEGSEFPNHFKVKDEGGDVFTVRVEYVENPRACEF